MRSKTTLFSLLVISAPCLSTFAQTNVVTTSNPTPSAAASPLVLGHGVGLFKVGPLLAQDDFEDLKNWVVQCQERSGFGRPRSGA